jgi:hypothetical protein
LESLEEQYKKYLETNPKSGISFDEWSQNIPFFAKNIFIGSAGIYSIDVEFSTNPTKSKSERLITRIREYYNKYYDINGRPPSKSDFNEFLDGFNQS